MENLFYAPPENFVDGVSVEISGQEAKHISRVLRYDIGDAIYVADGRGKLYHCEIANVTKHSVIANVLDVGVTDEPKIKKALAFGAIKKRDRLEFAVEKAVELGAWSIVVFNADHSERSKINEDRLQSIVISAFKQCKRTWLPDVVYLNSLEEVFEQYPDHHSLMAHVDSKINQPKNLSESENLLLVGPEGGFSDREVKLAKDRGSELISLGKNRLRAETAAVTFLAQYLFSE
jgi:16S rRNA (uracil1498-N3)-methyltransferase